MLASMTGFGRAVFDAPFGRLIAEIQSINRKYLDISVFMPREFSRFELEVRKWIGERVARGQINVRIHLIPNAASAAQLLPDPEVLRGLKAGWEKIAQQIGFDPKTIDLPFLMLNSPPQPKPEFARDADLSALKQCVKEAVSNLVEMKLNEGKMLAADLKERLHLLERHLKAIEELAPNAASRMREKLMEKMKELTEQEGPDLEERITREVILYAERIDISEELTRLASHFHQFQDILNPKGGSGGRKMDFLIQEIGREINTIGSKSAEAKISYLVVEMKSELEKMREQVQNIE